MKRNLATMLYSCSTDRVDSQDGCLVVQNSITRALVGANEPVLYLISSQIVKAAIADADLQTKHSEPKMLGMQTIYWLSGLLTIKKPSLQRLAFVFAGFGPYSNPIHVPCTDPFSGSSYMGFLVKRFCSRSDFDVFLRRRRSYAAALSQQVQLGHERRQVFSL